MKKILMGATICSLLFATGCSNEELIQSIDGQKFTIEATMGAESRTYNDGDGRCLWGEGEQIYVTSKDGSVFGILTLISNNGKTATFSGTVNGNVSELAYSFYPVPKNGKIPMGNLEGKNHNAPMSGSIGSGSVQMNYACGLVKLEFEGAEGEDIEVSAKTTGGTQTSVAGGHYEFDPSTGAMDFVPDGTSKVVINNIPESGVVYLPVNTTATSAATETIEVSVAIGNNEPVVADVQVAKGGVTASEENKFPEIKYDEEAGLVKINEIKTFADLQTAFARGGAYRLIKDINATQTLVVADSTLFLDLNGYHLQDTANFEHDAALIHLNGGRLEISNNSETPAGIYHSFSTIRVIKESNLAVNENVEIYSRRGAAIWLDKKDSPLNYNASNSSVKIAGDIVSDALYEAGDGWATIYTNGMLENINMEITDGEIVSDSVMAVYFAGNGNLTISGGEFTGYETAVEYRGNGELSISGGTFTQTGTPASLHANSNGSTAFGVALAASPHGNRSQNVEISNATFIAAKDCYAIWEGYVGTGTWTGENSFELGTGVKVSGKVHSQSAPQYCTRNCENSHNEVMEE